MARILLAMVLAFCMAMFPVAMERAVASIGHHDASASSHAHEQHSGLHAPDGCDFSAVQPLMETDCSASDEQASHEEGGSSACCGSIACHGFGVSAAPDLHVPVAYVVKPDLFHDQQTTGALSIRIERPPRAV